MRVRPIAPLQDPWSHPDHCAPRVCHTLPRHQPQERSEPGVCKVARYHGPLVLELKPMVPLVFRGSAAAFPLEPPRPAFAPVWGARAAGGDVTVVAADGSAEAAHRVVLQCRLPALGRAAWAPHMDEVRAGP